MERCNILYARVTMRYMFLYMYVHTLGCKLCYCCVRVVCVTIVGKIVIMKYAYT